MHSNSALQKSLPQCAKPRSTSASTLPQFSLLLFLVASFSRHRFGAAGRAENADVEQIEKSIPFMTSEISFCQ